MAIHLYGTGLLIITRHHLDEWPKHLIWSGECRRGSADQGRRIGQGQTEPGVTYLLQGGDLAAHGRAQRCVIQTTALSSIISPGIVFR